MLSDSSRHRGSSLLLVLWALILLSAAVFGFAKWMQQDIQINGEANRELEARAMAHSGLALALHPFVTKRTPGLAEDFSGGLGYRVRIQSEAGKLNINALLQGEDPARIAILKRWLEMRGLEFNEREILVDCLLDWVDPDNAHRLNGVEDEGDYHPPNRPLTSVEEIAQVRGSGPLTRTEGWKDALTVFGNGKIDLLAAQAEVLRLIPGLSEAGIQALIQARRGRDNIEGTIDDPEYKDVGTVLSLFFGMGPEQSKQASGLVTVNDQLMRIISEGHSANAYRHVEVVAIKTVQKPTILSWKE